MLQSEKFAEKVMTLESRLDSADKATKYVYLLRYYQSTINNWLCYVVLFSCVEGFQKSKMKPNICWKWYDCSHLTFLLHLTFFSSGATVYTLHERIYLLCPTAFAAHLLDQW